MRTTVLIIAASILLGCSATRNVNSQIDILPEKISILPESEAVLALFPCSREPIAGNPSAAPPTTSEVMAAENQLKQHMYRKLARPLADFYRQYVAIEIKGKRALIVSAFLDPFYPRETISAERRRRFIDVCDGGNAAWTIEYIIDQQRLVNFQVSSTFSSK
jgi:hypothetical protein